MLRRMIKTAMIGVLMVGFASSVTAQFKASGSVKEYFGQHTDTGVTAEEAASLQSHGEANMQLVGVSGPIMAFASVDIDSRRTSLPRETLVVTDSAGDTVKVKPLRNQYAEDARRFVQYTNGALSIKLGTIQNVETYGFTVMGGAKTFSLFWSGVTPGAIVSGGLVEEDGFAVYYKLPAVKLGLTIYDGCQNANAFLYSAPMYSSVGQMAILTDGDIKVLTASGAAGPLMYRVAYSMVTGDDPADDVTDAISGTMLMLGAMFKINDGMGVAFDYSSAGTTVNDVAYAGGEQSLKFYIKAGPGTMNVTYTMGEGSWDGEKTGSGIWTNLVYDVPLDKGVGVQAIYTNWSKEVVAAEDTYTTGFIGGGLYAAF